ncbi:hypothetical protein J7J26_03250 [Candidatus Micrarchaeota archaeon]|nr:hypothetical protein [Candidatus Micrarchaeota archaeon]
MVFDVKRKGKSRTNYRTNCNTDYKNKNRINKRDSEMNWENRSEDYIDGVYKRARDWVRTALMSIVNDYSKDRINLNRIFGVDKAKQISTLAHTSSSYASVDKLLNSEHVLAELWKSMRNYITGGSKHRMMTEKEYVSSILSILLNEMPVIKPFGNRFKCIKPLEDMAEIDPNTGKIILPTTRWNNEGVKIPSKMSFDSLPKALRSAQHTIDSLMKEYENNKQIIDELDKIITYLPLLGKGSTSFEREVYAKEILMIAERLKRKKHMLKIEARNMLYSVDGLDAVDLLRNSYDPDRIRNRRERNWPASRTKLRAARDRFIQRNLEIIEKLTPGMYIRKQKLLSGYEQYINIHNYIDRVITNYVNLLFMIKKGQMNDKRIRSENLREANDVINMVNNWLVPYIHDDSYNNLLWQVGRHLVESLRAMNKNNFHDAMDEVLIAREIQLKHYQALLIDKEGKTINVNSQ